MVEISQALHFNPGLAVSNFSRHFPDRRHAGRRRISGQDDLARGVDEIDVAMKPRAIRINLLAQRHHGQPDAGDADIGAAMKCLGLERRNDRTRRIFVGDEVFKWETPAFFGKLGHQPPEFLI